MFIPTYTLNPYQKSDSVESQSKVCSHEEGKVGQGGAQSERPPPTIRVKREEKAMGELLEGVCLPQQAARSPKRAARW